MEGGNNFFVPSPSSYELALHINHQHTHSTHARLSPIHDPFLCPETVLFSKAPAALLGGDFT